MKLTEWANRPEIKQKIWNAVLSGGLILTMVALMVTVIILDHIVTLNHLTK
jgi:hypothetical protein